MKKLPTKKVIWLELNELKALLVEFFSVELGISSTFNVAYAVEAVNETCKLLSIDGKPNTAWWYSLTQAVAKCSNFEEPHYVEVMLQVLAQRKKIPCGFYLLNFSW